MRKQMIWNAVHDVGIKPVQSKISSSPRSRSWPSFNRGSSKSAVPPVYPMHPPAFLREPSRRPSTTWSERAAACQCHKTFLETKEKIPGVRTVSWGNGDPCNCKIAQTDLRVVA